MSTVPAIHFSPARVTRGARAAWDRVVRVFESPWVAYGLLFALQLKVIFGLWAYRDVSGGDTPYYYHHAWAWYTEGRVNVAWSPLYTAYYGSFLFLNPDPVWATFSHRVVLILATTLLVLAVFRQLLPPSIAWLCAAWWAVLPIVFDTLFEVHLFAVSPVLVTWWLLATAKGPWRRAAALAVLSLAAALVRNELAVAVVLLALVLAWNELRTVSRSRRHTLFAYAVALFLAASVCGLAYLRSEVKHPQLADTFAAKHRVNMAQVYAFGYKQRHPEWDRDHWTECYPLMAETFGRRDPSLREMLASNPRAVWDHFAWNMALTPSGLQMLLFNQASGSVHPDYFPATDRRLNRLLPAILAGVLLAAWSFGLVCLWKGREWWRGGAPGSRLVWVGILAVVAVAPLVIVTQRPRPSYLFALGAASIALTGLCLWLAALRFGVSERIRTAAPVLAVAILLLVPGYFKARTTHTYRPMVEAVERLRPHAAELAAPRARLLTPGGVAGVGIYLTGRPTEYTEFATLSARWPESESFADCLAREKIGLVYLDERVLGQLSATRSGSAMPFIVGRDAPGWECVAGSDSPGERWRYYHRTK